MFSSIRTTFCIAAAIAASAPIASAFTTSSSTSIYQHQSVHPTSTSTSTALNLNAEEQSKSSRRSFLSSAIATASVAATTSTLLLPTIASAADTKETLLTDLSTSLTKISSIPTLVENLEWDKIRTVLKTPPVNQLWNLGESQNTLVKLAKETGDFDLLEMKDELAISLQMTDQYSYDNNFIYYQPGNGKIKTKEPLEMANRAISQLKDVIAVANSN